MRGVSFNPALVANSRERELSDQDEMSDHEEESDGEALESCHHRGRFLRRGRRFALGVFGRGGWFGEDGTINAFDVVLILEGRPSKETGEAEDISKELQRIGKLLDGIVLSQFVDLEKRIGRKGQEI
jgi:hypothetical protein